MKTITFKRRDLIFNSTVETIQTLIEAGAPIRFRKHFDLNDNSLDYKGVIFCYRTMGGDTVFGWNEPKKSKRKPQTI